MALQSRGQEACPTLRFGSLEFLKVELNLCSLDPVLWWVERMLAWVAVGGGGWETRNFNLCLQPPRICSLGWCPQIYISILAYMLEKQGSLVSFVKCLYYQKHFTVGAKPLVPLTQGL